MEEGLGAPSTRRNNDLTSQLWSHLLVLPDLLMSGYYTHLTEVRSPGCTLSPSKIGSNWIIDVALHPDFKCYDGQDNCLGHLEIAFFPFQIKMLAPAPPCEHAVSPHSQRSTSHFSTCGVDLALCFSFGQKNVLEQSASSKSKGFCVSAFCLAPQCFQENAPRLTC